MIMKIVGLIGLMSFLTAAFIFFFVGCIELTIDAFNYSLLTVLLMCLADITILCGFVWVYPFFYKIIMHGDRL